MCLSFLNLYRLIVTASLSLSLCVCISLPQHHNDQRSNQPSHPRPHQHHTQSLDERLPLIYLRIWENVEQEAELREPLKKLRQAAVGGGGQPGERERKPAAAAAAARAAGPPVGKGAGLRTTGLPPRAPLLPPLQVGGDGAGAAAAEAPGGASTTTAKLLRKEKRREADQDRRQEEKRRREREAAMKGTILKQVRARLEGKRAAQLEEEEEEEVEEAEGEAAAAGKHKGKMEEEEGIGVGAALSFGRIDLSGLGRRVSSRGAATTTSSESSNNPLAPPPPPPAAARRLLAELLNSSPSPSAVEQEERDVKELEAQMALVPSASAAAAPVPMEESEDGSSSESSSSGSNDGSDADSEEEEEDSDEGEGPLHLRLLVRSVDPPRWDPGAEWEAGVPAYAFPQAPLLHLTLVTDDDARLWELPPPPKEEEQQEDDDVSEPPPTPRGGHIRRRSRRLKSLADEASLKPKGRPAVMVAVNGREEWAIPAVEEENEDEIEEMETDTRPKKRRRREENGEGEEREAAGGEKEKAKAGPTLHPGDTALALLKLHGFDVQLVLPAAAAAAAAATAAANPPGETPALPALLREARLWGKGLLPEGGPGRRFHERMARAYYSWLHPLDLLPLRPGEAVAGGERAPLLVTPVPVPEELRGQGRVRVSHVVAPAGCAELWVGGRRVKHPAFLQRRGSKRHGQQKRR